MFNSNFATNFSKTADSKKNLKEVLASQMSVYESIGLEPQAILSTAIKCVFQNPFILVTPLTSLL